MPNIVSTESVILAQLIVSNKQDNATSVIIECKDAAEYCATSRQRHRGRVPGNIWSTGDKVSYIPAKFVKFLPSPGKWHGS